MIYITGAVGFIVGWLIARLLRRIRLRYLHQIVMREIPEAFEEPALSIIKSNPKRFSLLLKIWQANVDRERKNQN